MNVSETGFGWALVNDEGGYFFPDMGDLDRGVAAVCRRVYFGRRVLNCVVRAPLLQLRR